MVLKNDFEVGIDGNNYHKCQLCIQGAVNKVMQNGLAKSLQKLNINLGYLTSDGFAKAAIKFSLWTQVY